MNSLWSDIAPTNVFETTTDLLYKATSVIGVGTGVLITTCGSPVIGIGIVLVVLCISIFVK